MDLSTFLKAILPPSGPYFTASLTKKRLAQKQAATLEEAQQQIEGYIRDRKNAYVATGSYASERTINACTGKRVFYVDIDCKLGGQYFSKADAIKAIKVALERGLPPPTLIVDSGYGYHLYWIVEEVLTPTEWKALADTLIFVCAECKLNIDKGITQDAARIMRVPGTINYKDPETPVPCTVKRETGPIYTHGQLAERLNAVRKASPTPALPVDNDDLSSGVGGWEPPPAKGMLEKCPLFAANIESNGAGTAGVVWHKLIHTLAFTSDGEDYIHEISKAHDDYTPHATKARWDHAAKNRDQSGMGATKCATFMEAGAAECQTCPMRDQGRSPVYLAFREGSTTKDGMPWPYRNGIHGVEKWDQDAQQYEQILPEKITGFVATNDPGVTTHIEFTYGTQLVRLELTDLSNGQQAHVAFGRFGLHLTRYQIEQVNNVVHSFMQELRRTGKLLPPIQSYGWVGGGFHVGEHIYGPTEVKGTVKMDPNIVAAYMPCGQLAVWQECANHILGQQRQAAWAVIASAFAAPLMTFTGAEGSLLSIVSAGSGTGKSTALKVAQAVWGDPKDGVAHLNDTTNSVAAKLGVINNLPSYWDEVRGKDEVTNFVKLIFRLSQGKDKQRLNSNITQRRAGRWSTMMTIATNEAIREHIARTVGNSDAGAARVFEIYAESINDPTMSDGKARSFYRRLGTNFGMAGAIYAEYLGHHADEVEKLVTKIDDAICKKFNTTGDERYWVATVATLIAGATIANKLGLTKFQLPELKRYLLSQFEAMREYKHEEFATGYNRAVHMLKQFILAKTEHICWSERMPRRGNAKTMAFKQDSPRKPSLIRIATKDAALRFISNEFQNWVYETEGAGGIEIVKELTAHGAKRVTGSVDAGSPMSTGARYTCIEVQFQGAFAELADEYAEDDDINGDLG